VGGVPAAAHERCGEIVDRVIAWIIQPAGSAAKDDAMAKKATRPKRSRQTSEGGTAAAA